MNNMLKMLLIGGEESDYDPTVASEEEDPSIPESENASFESYKKGSNKKSGRGRGSRYSHNRLPSRPYLAAQSESEDDFFATLPRKKLSRACKSNPTNKPIMDIDIPTSSSPEEFDETIHVMSRQMKMRLEAEKALKAADASKAATTSSTPLSKISRAAPTIKEEAETGDAEMASPVKKMKEEPDDSVSAAN